jgi:hypothetical protein
MCWINVTLDMATPPATRFVYPGLGISDEDGHHCNLLEKPYKSIYTPTRSPWPGYFPWRMSAAMRSPIITTVGLIGARTRLGMIDASTMRNPSRPCTLPY